MTKIYKIDFGNECTKRIYLKGGAPWGFRVSRDNESHCLNASSKANLAGLRENDTILYVNNVSANDISLERAILLIDQLEDMCLVVQRNEDFR
jgi:hypothetical protein